jgi:putative flavoprotein involved in K+ transport
MAFPGDPGRYPLRDEVVEYLEQYSEHFQLPIKQKAQVVLVEREGTGFRVATADGQIFFSKAVVVATGAFSHPYVPEITGLQDFEGRVLHSANYATAKEFSGERVIVVGAANSAVQIAHEMAQVANVTLASREPVLLSSALWASTSTLG